ncbi:perlucin-like protein isoform X2 [Clavelina lepadiformis]|uniref:perlucin-like protein isoform X2 n=1 Tax=Clavelina lepadiformis TaxID=159417 RepID=UPI004041AEBC
MRMMLMLAIFLGLSIKESYLLPVNQTTVPATEENFTKLLDFDQEVEELVEQRLTTYNADLQVLFNYVKALHDPKWFSVVDSGNPNVVYQYQLTTTANSWHDSRYICQSKGGDLAVHGMKDYETRTNIGNVLLNEGAPDVWIGMNDISREGTFVWLDGSSASNVNWANGEPNNAGNEDCVLVRPRIYAYKLNDGACSSTLTGLCEKKVTL